jgi:hypothetical protein
MQVESIPTLELLRDGLVALVMLGNDHLKSAKHDDPRSIRISKKVDQATQLIDDIETELEKRNLYEKAKS